MLSDIIGVSPDAITDLIENFYVGNFVEYGMRSVKIFIALSAKINL